jgi:K+-sensing histidine kinase KdpD
MSVAAAIRINSADETRVVEHAAAFARQEKKPCFVISVVRELPYGPIVDSEQEIVRRNLRLIEASQAIPIMQEGDDVAQTLIAVARAFGIATMFVQSGRARFLGRSLAEQLVYLDPPFDVVVVGSQ